MSSSTSPVDLDESSCTMLDVLQEQEQMEDDADIVLGAAEDDVCTYEKSYVERQALYACLTCNPVGGGTRAGVCLGCSFNCHSGHSLVELYTKRHFRCDCGNDASRMTPCKLTLSKDTSNPENVYSANFEGLYCVCHRPYPDPEVPDEEQDEMIQCCNCEDWYHSQHLGPVRAPPSEQYSEMICPGCVEKLTFLCDYTALTVTVVTKETPEDGQKEVNIDDSAIEHSNGDTKKEPDAKKEPNANVLTNIKAIIAPATENTKNAACDDRTAADSSAAKEDPSSSTVDSSSAERNSDQTTKNGGHNFCGYQKCTRGANKASGSPDVSCSDSALFMIDDWRNKLCLCDTCSAVYASLGATHLTRLTDTIAHYEQMARRRLADTGRTSRERSVERELSALESVDRVTRTEMVSEYNTLSTSLRDYLRHFADTGTVVTDTHIKDFFSGLQARKKQKTMHGVPPSRCSGL